MIVIVIKHLLTMREKRGDEDRRQRDREERDVQIQVYLVNAV